MTRIIAIASLALSAGSACAQTVNLSIDIENPIISRGSSTDITLKAEFSTGDYAVAGIMTELVGVVSDGTITGTLSDWRLLSPMDGPGTTAGTYDDDLSMAGIVAGQLNFPPAGIFADPSNPIAFWQATFTAHWDGYGVIDFTTRTSRLDMYPERTSARSESRLDVLVEGSGQIWIPVPAPASAAPLLGLGLLARRRR